MTKSKMKRTLTNLMLAGTLALGLAGCGNHEQITDEYQGEIANESVNYIEKVYDYGLEYDYSADLKVKRKDGALVDYEMYVKYGLGFDSQGVPVLNKVTVIKDGETNTYVGYDESVSNAFSVAQEQAINYSNKVFEAMRIDETNKLKAREEKAMVDIRGK